MLELSQQTDNVDEWRQVIEMGAPLAPDDSMELRARMQLVQGALQVAVERTGRQERSITRLCRPVQVPLFATRALNATGQSRVTLSPR